MTIPDEAVEAAAKAIAGEYWRTAMDDARAALEAAAPFLMARAWDACAVTVEAATRLVAPDDITPMGARIINKVAKNNPYRSEA